MVTMLHRAERLCFSLGRLTSPFAEQVICEELVLNTHHSRKWRTDGSPCNSKIQPPTPPPYTHVTILGLCGLNPPCHSATQLLDCFVIPVVLLLSWFFLLVRYKAVHFVGVGVCLLGMGCMVGADVLVGRQQGLGDHKLLGDLLVLAGATLYGISNVCEEFIVKNLSRVEFLGMMGLFGSFFSGIQLAIMEHKELLKVAWDWQIGFLYIGFSACMFGLYSFMPVVIKRTSATAVNLSLLTADLYSLFCGLFLFQYKFSGLYLLSFFIIVLGLVLYSSSSTYVAQDPRVYKQFRNAGAPTTETPAVGPMEPSVTYTSLGQEVEEEPRIRVA
ncbi:hypothetical protein JZ751_005069 [Albula glossodonta]|uniref:Solute carrier family 35 member F1 n=1 Tax=Albula glossodonta TaxID=121402 RepID=A0A8T2PCZ0_9TELE|nr:hypothetical protein JZ751_005069 [Albula glossodonta]